jgi:hypothetical protein
MSFESMKKMQAYQPKIKAIQDKYKGNPQQMNKEVMELYKKHKINPIISELRHSYFWDGGISCCTQDLTRKGGLETYL